MSPVHDWLPDLLLADCDGDWQRYEDKIYSIFYMDFIESRPVLENMPVYVKRFLENGKERSFWHCIQEGSIEEHRIPDFRRCERIGWIRSAIEHANDPAVKTWSRQIRGKSRYLLWLEEAEYLVVLERRTRTWVLVTAYCVTQTHRKRKLQKQYEASRK